MESLKRDCSLPEAGVFPPFGLWAQSALLPPCMDSPQWECGTAGPPPWGKLFDLASPSNPCWLSRGNHDTSRLIRAEALQATSRPASDRLKPLLSVTGSRPAGGGSRGLPQKHSSCSFIEAKDAFPAEELRFIQASGSCGSHGRPRATEEIQTSQNIPFYLWESRQTIGEFWRGFF